MGSTHTHPLLTDAFLVSILCVFANEHHQAIESQKVGANRTFLVYILCFCSSSNKMAESGYKQEQLKTLWCFPCLEQLTHWAIKLYLIHIQLQIRQKKFVQKHQEKSSKTLALLPSRFREGRRGASSIDKIVGEQRGLLLSSGFLQRQEEQALAG